MIRVKTADILTICHDRTNNRPSWLNRGWKIIANGYARGTNNCFAGATTIAVGNPKGNEIINASITDCGRSLSIHIVAARQLKDGVYHRRSDILFLPILLRNMSQMRVKNDKKVNIIQHSPILSPFINRDKIKNFPFCRTYMTII